MSKPAVKTAVFFLAVLACTFFLSYAWEHGWEAEISRRLDLPYDEDFEDAERWRFIITAIAFSALSLLVPTAAMHFLFVRLAVSHAQLLSSRETAVSMAFTDALTGLPNRRSLTEELEAIAEIRPSPEKVHALILIDLDRFKSVNDVFGHGIGDLLLKQVGKRLVSIDVSGIVVCRLGGDEFACSVALVHRSATGHYSAFDTSPISLVPSRLGSERIAGVRRQAFGSKWRRRSQLLSVEHTMNEHVAADR